MSTDEEIRAQVQKKPEPVETVTSTGYDEWLREAKAASPDAESFPVPARFVGVGRLADDDEPVQEASTIRAEDLLARYSEITDAMEAGWSAQFIDADAAHRRRKQRDALLAEMREEGARIRKERGGNLGPVLTSVELEAIIKQVAEAAGNLTD